MKFGMLKPRGMLPFCAAQHLPDGFGTDVLNAKVSTGNLEGFNDIGNPYTLAKSPAPFNTLWLMRDPTTGNTYWLQWLQSEVMQGVCIDVSLGTIPGDESVRTFITGLDQPRQTTLFYATDPSQQGASPQFAYPYKTFPLAVNAATVAPVVTAPGAPTGPTQPFEYSQPSYVNSALINAAGQNYRIGDILTVPGGTVVFGLPPAQLKVTQIGAGGSIADVQLYSTFSGFYTAAPPASGNLNGGSGTGATYNSLVTLTNTSAQTWQPTPFDNGAGSYGHFSQDGTQWIISSGQGDTYIYYSTDPFNLKTSSGWTMQADVNPNDSGGAAPDLLMQFCGTYNGQTPFARLNGPCVVASPSDGSLTLFSTSSGTNGGAMNGTVVAQHTGLTISHNTYYRITIAAAAVTAGTTQGFNVTATLALQATPGTVIATVSGFVPYGGEQMAVGLNHRGNSNNENTVDIQNIYITSTQPGAQVTGETTDYVTTYNNIFDQGSAPSPPSNLVTVYLNTNTTPNTFGPATVVIAPDAANGVSAFTMDLWRLVNTGGTSEVYEYVTTFAAMTLSGITGAFTVGETVTGSKSGATGTVLAWNTPVLELSSVSGPFTLGETLTGGTSGAHGTFQATALGTASITYEDTALDSALDGTLPSGNPVWAPPPANMVGIIALPNAIMAGFFANTLCLSVPNFPQAWPVEYQYTTDFPIVALAVFANAGLILTTGNPYVAYGNDPSQFFMVKEKAVQGCVSKRSVAVHKVLGAIYASGNGLCYYRGQGDLDLIRIVGMPLFTYEQWQQLNPSSIKATVHQDLYFFWGTDLKGNNYSFMLDPNPNGFGLVEIDVHVSCAYNDPNFDNLFLVPDQSLYPVNGAVVSAPSNVVSQWDYPGSPTQRAKRWLRNLFLMPWQMLPGFLRLRSRTGYTGITVTLSNENGVLYNGPPPTTGDSFNTASGIEPGMEYSLGITDTGSNRIMDCLAAEAVEEFQ
jgi:hypothetical protein